MESFWFRFDLSAARTAADIPKFEIGFIWFVLRFPALRSLPLCAISTIHIYIWLIWPTVVG